MDIADIFINQVLLEKFDKKPLDLQALEIKNMKDKYDLFNKQYQKNSGKRAGAPTKWTDKEIEEIIARVEVIKNSHEYNERKNSREKDITAYIILIEHIFKEPKIQKLLEDNKLKKTIVSSWNDKIRSIAQAFKQAVVRYKKRSATKT